MDEPLHEAAALFGTGGPPRRPGRAVRTTSPTGELVEVFPRQDAIAVCVEPIEGAFRETGLGGGDFVERDHAVFIAVALKQLREQVATGIDLRAGRHGQAVGRGEITIAVPVDRLKLFGCDTRPKRLHLVERHLFVAICVGPSDQRGGAIGPLRP